MEDIGIVVVWLLSVFMPIVILGHIVRYVIELIKHRERGGI